MKWTRYVFFIFWAVTLLSFIPSIGAGFVYDFLGWQKVYNRGSFADIIHSFGYHGNHQFLHLIFYSFYKLFGTQGLAWYFFFCTLHAVNGYLFYVICKRFVRQWGGTLSPVLAAFGALIFLLHPYCVEPVVWKVCVHYLLSCMEVMLILILFLRYLESGEKKIILLGGLIFTVSLFTLELALITPLAVTFCGLITYLQTGDKKKTLKPGIRYAGMMWLLTIGYLVLNKLTLGSIVGHYGEKVHLHFDLIAIVSAEMKYLFKHLFYARFYSFKFKNLLFDQVLPLPEVAFFFLSVLLSVFILYFIKARKILSEWHVAFFGLFISMLYILPVANIYFFHLHIGMNDRYSYIPMAFLIIAIVALLNKCRRWFSYGLMGLLLVINIYFQQKTLKYWRESTEVLTSLKENFRWNDASYVFVLNSPDNMGGIVMTSIINEPSGIEELIHYQTPYPFTGKMYDVFQYNMTSPGDGVKVEQVGPMQLKVTFNQWGNWWHRNGIGAGNYENEYYKAELMDYPYMVTFKQLPEGSVIIYQDGKEWKEFTMEKG
ncbi:MAG TPA: hypothetical protein VFG10_15405 [Saprospiraceae bacterium]|nr:hypothetical protein [Saprospiraceae bacterium]